VAAHGHGGLGVDFAVEAGVRTIEHGTLLSDEQLQLMAAKDVTLVLTTGVIHKFAVDPRVPEAIREMMPPFRARALAVTRAARAAGVRVAVGSDGVHGGIADEVGFLIDGGYTLAEALTAATGNAARVLNRPDLGVLEVGALADLLVVDGDPFEDRNCLSEPLAGVMLAGSWFQEPSLERKAHLSHA
jgi:imidazolonepropionase-like amidohydrolase